METNEFTYDVGIVVDFTDDELELLRRCCVAHYDGRVKAAAKQGGFLYGWLNARSMGIDIRCSSSHLDTCAKALEQPPQWRETDQDLAARSDLRVAITGVLKSLSERTKLLADAEIVPTEDGQ